jgi:glutaredoxin-related protein|tara:strand:- start:520 stop:1173 length:654 start_codon:yes stop_codon:yes gene_type:complete
MYRQKNKKNLRRRKKKQIAKDFDLPPPNRNPNLNTGGENKKSFPVTKQTQNIRTRYAECYYSNQCKYCKELLEEINRFNIRSDKIVLINIDENRKNIPPQIQRVPTIFDRDDSKIYVGEEAFTFITNMIKQSTVNVMAVNTGVAASFSETFGTLDGNDGFSNNACLDSANFSSVNDMGHINIINEKKENDQFIGNDFAQKLEELQQSRQNDIKQFKH